MSLIDSLLRVQACNNRQIGNRFTDHLLANVLAIIACMRVGSFRLQDGFGLGAIEGWLLIEGSGSGESA